MRRQTNPITPHETWLNLFWSKLCIFCGLYFDFVLSPVFRRFVFLHLDTLPRSDFPGSHGAKKHYRLALFWARARQNFWCDFLQGKKVELFSLARFWRRKQKNLSLTLRAREKIWSRLVGKSNINRKRLLTFLNGAISHPRRPRSSQSGREKRRDESFQVRAKEPGCRLVIGHKKCFVLLCTIGEQFLLSSFREFVHDGYCLATLARFVHQACACKENFYFPLS